MMTSVCKEEKLIVGREEGKENHPGAMTTGTFSVRSVLGECTDGS